MWLVVTHGGRTLRRELAPGQALVLGRGTDCDIAIDDVMMSRRHARIALAPGGVQVEDLGSRNGTFLLRTTREHVDATARRDEARLPANRAQRLDVDAVLQIGAAVVTLGGPGDAPPAPGVVPGIVIVSDAMRDLHHLAAKVARSDITVLLLGESGVGKEVLAAAIHARSPRAHGPFVTLNCAAVAEGVLESELFGHARGAFTGAVRDKPGHLEAADGGTVFLDEIGELPAALQAKLLRVLEDRRVTRVGELAPRAIDVRFVAATNRNLVMAIGGGTFREDLYHRLDGIALTIPPLRERADEIVPLAEAFARGRAALAPDAIAALRAHAWPGNVRELKNVIERAVVLADGGRITMRDLQLAAPVAPARPTAQTLPARSEAVERAAIVEALERCAGNQTKAAHVLGISRRMLVARLGKYDLPRPRK
jgi:two-component system, NtrC family, response regulator AtoC